jgi:hypothetical protein
MAAMSEVSQQQVLDLLYEVADDVSDVRAELHELLALMKKMNHEAELGMQRIVESRTGYYGKVSSP